MRGLDVPDLLAIAARVLDYNTKRIVEEADLELLAISASELRTVLDADELALPAYVLLYGLDTRRPFPRSNRRIAVAATLQFVALNGGCFELEPVEPLDATLDLVREDEGRRSQLYALVRERVRPAEDGPAPPPPQPLEPMGRTPHRMFERFTERARRVVVLAQEEARKFHHNYIGTEHILLGLIHEGEGIAAKVLDTLGISPEAVRAVVEEVVGQGSKAPSGHIPFTPRAKKVLELAYQEALQLGHNYIGTEHILLGLIREGQGVAAQSLVKLGAELDRVRAQVVEQLSGYRGPGMPAVSESRRQVLHDELDALLEENARLRIENRRLRRRLARLASMGSDPFDDLFGPDDWPDDWPDDLGGARASG